MKELLKITSFDDEHLQDAAALVSIRYTQLRKVEQLLPRRYEELPVLLPLLSSISTASEHGVVAIRSGRLVGFLTGWIMPSFRGKRSTFSPEWANAADLEDSRYIYEEMYSHLAADWVADKCVSHYISIFPNDSEAISAFHWMGFGMVAVDAIRSLESIPCRKNDIEIRLAGMHDLEEVMALDKALWQYMRGTPVFLLQERKQRSHYEEWIRDPGRSILLAFLNEELVAFMSLGPANEDACTINRDEGTTSIYGAFTKENRRGEGIATALLNHALAAARVEDYERCVVDFEPMNLTGTRFWLRHFRPVCCSLFRQIDERLTDF